MGYGRRSGVTGKSRLIPGSGRATGAIVIAVMPSGDPIAPLDDGDRASAPATARRVLLIAFYVAILISMAVVICW